MNRRGLHILLFTFLCQAVAFGQLDSIQELPKVVLADRQLTLFSKGFKLERLADSVVKRNPVSLTDVLRHNSSIYFKENGSGMVSSPSFRGTNAAQTAVIWNGININSIFTGQTDFNTISPFNYDEISIRSGGGGVQFGSGAVGGSVHVNNNFSFDEADRTEIGMRYGSFSTLGGNASTTKTWGDHYLNVGVDFISSDNDYDYVGKNKKNLHGEYLRFTANLNQARRLNRGVVSLNSEYSYNDRNFSGSLNTIGRDGYKDVNTRNLLQLRQKYGRFNTTARVAHLFEQFRYYPDSEGIVFSEGRANTLIGGIESETMLGKAIKILAKVEYTLIDAQGDNTGNNERRTFSAVMLMNHKLSKNFNYGINLRKDFSNDFENPFLFSADAKWTLSQSYALRLNGSKNYRVPTFNDLYWYAGGNYKLKPETSYQVELGQEFHFGNFIVDLAAFYISSEDLIKWVPGNGSLWRPSNISKAQNFGVEAKTNYGIRFNKHQKLDIQLLYSYTNAEDKEKQKQLIYVPFHNANFLLNYGFKNLSAYFQGMFTGKAFSTTDNSDFVEASTIFNLGVDYSFSTIPNISIGGRIKNIFNTYYENVAYRPMPSRNFQIFLNFNI
ncbi:TonB-dependent receptor [Aequorivita viscosa]|uniref:Iron complex outermembrane recepter protein n=1 Tax=Aequorivita viscosa TaxID=797419 RepID=A0A1M6JCK6_9FLAO|nr:TonB-dependent receptor [Aequorivita viscosa]SDX09686.1 iron complex outermembrane recepter protein [Aequorivita viscosa]SHJ44441.1 iron complex outermembrane recepter protein [Aequorivita viscosa]